MQDSRQILSPNRKSKLQLVDNKFEKKFEKKEPRKDGGMFSPREVSKNPIEKMPPESNGIPNMSQPPIVKK